MGLLKKVAGSGLVQDHSTPRVLINQNSKDQKENSAEIIAFLADI
jgi:hypothetical protein